MTETPFGAITETDFGGLGYHAFVAGAPTDGVEQLRAGQLAKSRGTVEKAGRVLSDSNLKLVLAAMDALRSLIESTGTEPGDLTPTGKAVLVDAYGWIAQDARLPLLKLAQAGDIVAATWLRAAIDDDDLLVKVLKNRAERPSGPGLGTGACNHPLQIARAAAAAMFRT